MNIDLCLSLSKSVEVASWCVGVDGIRQLAFLPCCAFTQLLVC